MPKTKDSKTNSLDLRIREIAKSGSCKGFPKKFTLPQNKEARLLHIDICKKLVALSEANGNYPITYLVYFAVSKNAHRFPVFFEGYTKIDEKKATTIFNWLKLFAKHNKNPKLFRNPNLAHALCRFYDKYSTKTKDFKAALEKYEPNPKVTDFKMVAEGLGIAKQPKTEDVDTTKQPKTEAKKTEAKKTKKVEAKKTKKVEVKKVEAKKTKKVEKPQETEAELVEAETAVVAAAQ